MTNPEIIHHDIVAQFIRTIDDKFATGTAKKGPREHEEQMALIPTSPLCHCPTASRVYLERPIPEEADEALSKWSFFGGHRVVVFEAQGSIQTDFHIHEGQVYKRQIVSYPGDQEPLPGETKGDQLLRRAGELLGDALSLTALSGIERAAIVRARNIGEPLPPQEVPELLGWVNDAIAEPS